jgi:hypothetical protein
MSSQRERQLWTEYAEMRQRQRTQTARKPCAKRVKGLTPEELEQALDDLVSEAEQRSSTERAARKQDERVVS